MGILQAKVKKVLASHIPSGESVELYDYGTIQGSATATEAARATIAIVSSSTASHKAHDYIAIAITKSSVITLPVRFKSGLLGTRLVPVKKREARIENRAGTQFTVGKIEKNRGMWNQDSVVVRVVFEDETGCIIEFYDNPERWPAFDQVKAV